MECASIISPAFFVLFRQSLLGGGGGLYWNQPVSQSGGQFVCKILPGQPLQFQSNSLYTWQKYSLGAVDVQDTNFVKIPSRITELLPLIWLKIACLDNSPTVSVWFTLNFAEVFIRSWRCARHNFCENSIKNYWVIAPDIVKIIWRINELMPLIHIKNVCLDNSSYNFSLIGFILSRSIHLEL